MKHLITSTPPVGTMSRIELGDQGVLLVMTKDGSLYAFEDKCSHADVKLSRGTVEDDKIVCTAHGAKFDAASGAAKCLPAVRPIKKYIVTKEADQYYIEVG